jgi:hypothetical protein
MFHFARWMALSRRNVRVRRGANRESPLFELARALVRLDHVALA